jgi:glycine/sarcosine N-methyltransferase
LGPLLERECGASSIRLLDCACGIGTQAVGLARRGHQVTACDISGPAVERARSEAASRGLRLRLYVADMLELDTIPEQDFQAVISMDNALPHLNSEDELLRAAAGIRRKLRTGGIFAASIRDYDRVLLERPVVHGPAFYGDSAGRRIVHQIWDWTEDRRYTFHLYITCERPEGWESHHYAATYRVVLRDELTAILKAAGFNGVRWIYPEESGFYQPVVLARA